MSILADPDRASVAARVLQLATAFSAMLAKHAPGADANRYKRMREYPRRARDIAIPTSIAAAPAVVYAPQTSAARPPVHVNFHGGGFVLPQHGFDDPLCRFLAAEASVVVVDVDYVVAPQYPFPKPAHQAYEVVQWVAAHGAEQGWDGGRLTIGGQSAGGSLAAAAARQALERNSPAIALQVLHYPVLDLSIPARQKRSTIAKPRLRPWMCDIFDAAYVPDQSQRTDRLVSPVYSTDTADLVGIAPALVITPEQDILRAEAEQYAERLRQCGCLAAYYEVPNADHAYDMNDDVLARSVYSLIAQHLIRATNGREGPAVYCPR